MRTILLFISLIITFSSCNPFISKTLRKKNRCNRKIEKIIEKCPDALVTDTIIEIIEVPVPEIRIKDSIQVEVDTLKVDSLIQELLKIKDQKQRVRYLTENIQESLSIDTTIVKDGVTVTISLSKGFLSIEVFKPESKIKVIDTDIVNKVQKIELTLWEHISNLLGRFWWWGIIMCIILATLYVLSKLKR